MSVSLRGQRLLGATIDHIATSDPERPWVSAPRDDEDISRGFVDITYNQLANAINHAATWLQSTLGPNDGTFETFAYEGPKDVRPAILACAAAKAGRSMLLPFPLAPPAAKLHLIDATGCNTFLCAESSLLSVDKLLAARPQVRRITVPALENWITASPARPFPYDKTWDEAKNDPWIIFHTSGTTGFPKPVVYTQLMMTSLDQSENFPDVDEKTSMSLFKNSRVHSTLPMDHFVGMTGALQSPVFLGTILVIGPAFKPPTAALTDQVIKYGNVTGFASPPFVIRGLCRQQEYLERLRQLDYIQWAGAPLDSDSGNLLCEHVQLSPAIGTTECGPYFTKSCAEPSEWSYYWFRGSQGIELEPISDKYFELVFRKSNDALWQQIFYLRPELEVYRTQDIFERHPTKGHLWLYAGRTDDIMKLANGHAIKVSDMEATIMRNAAVRSALVGGAGRNRPILLVELVDGSLLEDAIRAIWPDVEAANEPCSYFAKIHEDLIIFADPGRPFVRSPKDSVMRKETLALYGEDIDFAYAQADP